MNLARGAVLKAMMVVLVAGFGAACATPGEKQLSTPATSGETPQDTLGDWNTREPIDPIERLLRPIASAFA